MELRRNLLNEAEDLAPYELWRSLFRPEIAPRQGAANALALLESLLEQGDPASWDKVSGLFHPSLVSKPLAAADGIFMAVAFLLEMEDKNGVIKAQAGVGLTMLCINIALMYFLAFK